MEIRGTSVPLFNESGVLPMDGKDVITLIVAVIGSGAVFGFLQFIIQFLVTRNDMKQNFGKKLEAMDAKIDRNQAILARTHILRFADDLRNHGSKYHSEEYYRQQILDCDLYENYCKANPDFSNGLTIVASKYIRNEFEKLYTERKNEDETTQ